MSIYRKIIFGDAGNMSKVADSSVHLIVTSPPYWNLKDYGHKKQIGFGDSYKEYIAKLNAVWQECFRVLKPGCKLCINVGDICLRSTKTIGHRKIPIQADVIRGCCSLSFGYVGAIIWHKYTNCRSSGGACIMGSYPLPRNGVVKLDYEYILLFSKPGKSPVVSNDQKEASKLTLPEWKDYFQSSWRFPGARQSEHMAMFPEEIPKRLIKMFSFVGETILDPFLGSGTTMRAALSLKRKSIGYEINKRFLPIINRKIVIH